MKPRYRFKGRFPNGERKIIIEYENPNILGKIRTCTLPKPGTLLRVLLLQEKLNKNKDGKTCALGEPLVNT